MPNLFWTFLSKNIKEILRVDPGDPQKYQKCDIEKINWTRLRQFCTKKLVCKYKFKSALHFDVTWLHDF